MTVLCIFASAALGRTSARAQTLPASGGFVEPVTSVGTRPLISAADASAMLPARGMFTFPEPYHTTGFRLTTDADCGGGDCVRPVGYSYWNNINNHSASHTMLVFLSLDRHRGGSGPSLFSVDKRTGETRNLGPLFPASSPLSWSSGDGWYFSRSRPYALYLHSGPRLLRYDVQVRTFQTVFDVTGVFGPNRFIWQAHSSNDDRVHSAALRDNATYASLGCIVYREDGAQWYFAPAAGDFDECQIDKSGRWLVIKENVDGLAGEDNRVIDLQTGTEQLLLDQMGAPGHSDVGFGYMVGADNHHPQPGAVRLWRFDRDLRGGEPVAATEGQGTLVYRLTSWAGTVGHLAHGNALAGIGPERQIACSSSASRQLLPRVNEVVCYRVDGSLQALVVAPNLTSLDAAGGGSGDYAKLPKGNLDPTGEYFVWTANAGTERLDAFVVHVPTALLAPAPVFEPVQWTDLVNVTADAGTLQKTGGCQGCPDAGAASLQQIVSGEGALRFTASESSGNRAIGFSAGNLGTQANEILYGLRLRSGNAEVREGGVFQKDVRFVIGDTFEIRIESGTVRYLRNGVLFYTSARPVTYPLLVDTSLSTLSGTLTNVLIKPGS
jgi:hypothetical protein